MSTKNELFQALLLLQWASCDGCRIKGNYCPICKASRIRYDADGTPFEDEGRHLPSCWLGKLIRGEKHERIVDKTIEKIVKEAVETEREECAKIADEKYRDNAAIVDEAYAKGKDELEYRAEEAASCAKVISRRIRGRSLLK